MCVLDFSKKENGELNLGELKKENFQSVVYFLKLWFSISKTLFVQTSGSTGKPKIIEVEKQNMLNSAKMTCDFLGLKSNDTALLCLPVEYISGKMMLVRAIERGLKIKLEKPSLTPLKNLTESVDFCAMTPLQVEHSLDKIHLIKKLIIGGAEVSEKLRANMLHSQSQIFETYGMSETLSHIALRQIAPKGQDYFKVLGDIIITQDERNCLVIEAPKLTKNKLITNDIVEIVQEGEFKFLGRIDHVINSAGVKIFPELLEQLVKSEVYREVVFIGIPDETLGQKLVLVVEGIENKQIMDQLSEIKYQQKLHRPKEIIFIKKIPRTPNGKVSRQGLLDLLYQ